MLRALTYRRGLTPLFFCIRDGWFWFDADGVLQHSNRNPRIFARNPNVDR